MGMACFGKYWDTHSRVSARAVILPRETLANEGDATFMVWLSRCGKFIYLRFRQWKNAPKDAGSH